MIRIISALCLMLAALPARAAVDIQEVTSPGGINAWLVESHEIPFVALEIRFQGGAGLDAPGKRGAINLMTGLLEEGAGDMDARAFATARDGLAARISFDVHNDALSVSAQFLTENRDQGVELLHLALTEPRFDDDAVERVRGQVLGGIRARQKDPDDIASDRFNALAFGDHPYGSDVNGTLDGVAALTRDDLIAAKDRVMARDRLFVSAVGDITAEELGALLDRLFDGLPETGAPMPGRADFALTGGIDVVPYDTPQSVVVFGHTGIPRDDPDFFAAYVLNSVLGGGGFSSRLMEEVREKRGLTYGIATYLYNLDHADMVLGKVASANNRVAEAIEVIRAEWARAATEGITEDELDTIKTYLTGSYPLRFDGNGPIANIMVGMQMEGLGLDYIATRNDKVNAVTLDDVRRVAARLLDADALHFVVVGQPEGLPGN
ncbi:M16 family metallopeptidase [Actibacterium sp. XHP0104]|uniref:M16 family metallopeptidase n=1 Tax=Actibacterium sp. XHP0104 TaxID=2984335 RepID=UPI0021E87047|nr:pitrilysin family protein [Actibacterium sp. XHP0104]MCV2881919.1 insulinase family protein [Actibacterium sp. XHP0104]